MNLFKKLLCVGMLGGLAFQIQAQTATINNDLVITVASENERDGNDQADTQYVIDISKLNLNKSEATELFQQASEHNVVDFALDYDNQVVTLNLALDKVPASNRSVANVNKYLNYYSARLRSLK